VNATIRRQLAVKLGLAILIGSLMSLALLNGFLRPLQLQSGDLLFRLKPDTTAKWTVLVAIDDRSLAELRSKGRFYNWPRDLHAKVTDNLKAAGARIIAWDVLFDAPAEGDSELVESIRQAGNVLLAEVGDEATRLPAAPGRPHRYGAAIEPLPAFRDAAIGTGHANVLPDTDGVIRATPLIMQVGDDEVPALPMLLAAKFLRRPQVFEAPIQDGKLPFAGRDIPLHDESKLWISYLGDSSKVTNPPTFPTISYVDALNNTFSMDVVRSKAVVVGVTGSAFGDDYWTPISRSRKMDGVEIQANTFETIMRPELFIRPAGQHTMLGLIYLAALVPALALLLLPPLPALLLGIVAALGYLAVAVTAVDYWQIILDLPFPVLTLGLSYVAILLYRVIFEQAQQRALKGALSQYLSPDVMEEVARDPSALRLGGEKRDMTVLFSDVRGFTSLSEQMEPERLVHLLNVYLTRMSDVIFRHQGTIDKYMGDAIMAFWGAPKSQPNHARLACQAALGMMAELTKLNSELGAEGLPRLDIGIGLNSGPMSVGNMGSDRRFDYTVMGDAVNLGSRLEGLNKEYGTNVIVSETTLAQAGADVGARFVDLVAVKGKKEPCAVYELISMNGRVDGKLKAALAAYERGVERYRAGDYTGAQVHFAEALRLDGDDGVSVMYLERCRGLAENPPPADWDGVYVMTHK
jgi:adenylate cyclase